MFAIFTEASKALLGVNDAIQKPERHIERCHGRKAALILTAPRDVLAAVEPFFGNILSLILVDLERDDVIRLEFARHSSRDKSGRAAEWTHGGHRVLIGNKRRTAAVADNLMTVLIVPRDIAVAHVVVLFADAERSSGFHRIR